MLFIFYVLVLIRFIHYLFLHNLFLFYNFLFHSYDDFFNLFLTIGIIFHVNKMTCWSIFIFLLWNLFFKNMRSEVYHIHWSMLFRISYHFSLKWFFYWLSWLTAIHSMFFWIPYSFVFSLFFFIFKLITR